MCQNCCNMGCKYRFEDITMPVIVDYQEGSRYRERPMKPSVDCINYQPDSDDGQYLYFDDEWNAPEIKQ
jgi:hypothetical protein